MSSLNNIWSKATKILNNDNNLLDLYGDFVVQDNIEFKLKQENVIEQDKILKNLVDKRLLAILLKHGLGRIYLQDHHSFSKMDFLKFDEFYFEIINKDKQLAHLWEQSNDVGLSDEELESLKLLFIDYLKKHEEYESLRRSMKSHEGTGGNSLPRIDNDLSNAMNDELKSAHNSMKSVYNEIQKALREKILKDQNVVKDYRVVRLWSQALSLNLSESSLSLFQDELEIFNGKLLKYNHFLKKAEIAKLQSGLDQKSHEAWSTLNEKVKQLAKQVKKWNYELKAKLVNQIQHAEL